MYEKELKELKDRVSALTDKDQKELGEKKIKKAEIEIALLVQMEPIKGTEAYKVRKEATDRLLNWEPGKKGGKTVSRLTQINSVFGEKGTIAGVYMPEILLPGKKISTEALESLKALIEKEGYIVKGKDWHTPSHQDKVALMVCKDNVITLDRSLIPGDWK